MITRIEATRYRALERLDTDLSSYAVLVGANGAGKTTFLGIPNLLGDCLQQREIGQAFTTRLDDRPPRCSNLQELVFGGKGNEFLIAIEARLPESVISALLPSQSGPVQNNENRWLRFLRYEIRFEIFNERQLIVGNEYLFLFARSTLPERDETKPGKVRLYGEVDPHREWRFIINRDRTGEVTFRPETQKGKKARPTHVEGGMLALPRVQFESANEFPASRWLFDLLTKSCVFYHPNIDKLQTASPPGLPNTLMPNAANLPWLVLELQEDEDRFLPWVEHLKTALPQIRGFGRKNAKRIIMPIWP
ncbi:MAG: AAA family ATPase [Gemmataceae bacterium]